MVIVRGVCTLSPGPGAHGLHGNEYLCLRGWGKPGFHRARRKEYLEKREVRVYVLMADVRAQQQNFPKGG